MESKENGSNTNQPTLKKTIPLLLALAAGPISVAGYYGKGLYDNYCHVEEAEQRTKDQIYKLLADDDLKLENLDMQSAVPECQRTAEDILLTVPYVNTERENFEDFFESNYGNIVRALPDYAVVHLAVQDDFVRGTEKYFLEPKYHRKFRVYPVSNQYAYGWYAQDIGEATGGVSKTGQFQFLSPSDEIETIKGKYKGMNNPPPTHAALNFYLVDNLLARMYESDFETKNLDAVFSGGNTTIGLTPDSEKCVFLHAGDIVKYMHAVLGIDPQKPMPEAEYEKAKDNYKKAFGTKNIVVVDEEEFMKKAKHGDLYKASMYMAPFFHNDMIFTQHVVEDKPIMFVSNMRVGANIYGGAVSRLPQESLHQLDRISAQFKNMGYRVVEIPAIVPDQNFANVVAFTNKETRQPSILLNYYHTPEVLMNQDQAVYNGIISDAFTAARNAYEQAGIKVVPVSANKDNADSINAHFANSSGKVENLYQGGIHCRVQVLR